MASSALCLAGCGGADDGAAPAPRAPRIPVGVAKRLAADADRVAELAPGSCEARDAAARLRAEVIAAIGKIPPRYQEPLLSAANDLAARLATCAVVRERARPRGDDASAPPTPRPAAVRPIPRGDDAREQARNIGEWLRARAARR